jgi:hypothetical protein
MEEPRMRASTVQRQVLAVGHYALPYDSGNVDGTYGTLLAPQPTEACGFAYVGSSTPWVCTDALC